VSTLSSVLVLSQRRAKLNLLSDSRGPALFFTKRNADVSGLAIDDLKRTVASVGEPFLSGFDPDELPHLLSPIGMMVREDLSDKEVVARYDPSGLNGFKTGGHSRVVHVVKS
jgi:hypothetical protein